VTRFRDRADAGRQVAARLVHYADRPGLIVLALPRGGVPVALEVARQLDAPLDVFVVRKLGVPGHEELAMGAIATGGARVLNEEVVARLAILPETVDAAVRQEAAEVARRERLYRGDRPPPQLGGRIVILVDDGLATGATMRAAVAAVRQQRPERIVVAVPAAAPETCGVLRIEVDELICVLTPDPFVAVGFWYENFSQIGDDAVRELLERATGVESPKA
jgi:putative phosphoribosyl transferase